MPREPMPVEAGMEVDAAAVDGAQCSALIEQHPEEGYIHIPCTDATNYQTVPPSSGNHYGCWPEYRTFALPVPWGNLVHALEHGAIVIVYNCGDAGCLDEVARAQAFIDALPADPSCAPDHRVILAPDPTLDVRWAATRGLLRRGDVRPVLHRPLRTRPRDRLRRRRPLREPLRRHHLRLAAPARSAGVPLKCCRTARLRRGATSASRRTGAR
jgi:hypothetical protein